VALDAATGQLVEAFTPPRRPWWRETDLLGPKHDEGFRGMGHVFERPTGRPRLTLDRALKGGVGEAGQVEVRYVLYTNRNEGAERRPALVVFREGLILRATGGDGKRIWARGIVVLDAETGEALLTGSYGNPLKARPPNPTP
jgi:hypothetical protein